MCRMTIATYFVTLVATATIVSAEVELRLKPFGDTFAKPLGNSILFTCEVTGNVRDGESYNLKWLDSNDQEITEKTGRPQGGSQLYVEQELPSIKKLYITNIEKKDEGRYRCVASVDGRQQEKSVKLVLFKDITFDHAPSPQHPSIYSDALIECRVSGAPSPTVSWRYKGDRIQFGVGSRYTEESSGIRIKNITLDDDGEYTCRAEVEAEGRYNERKISVLVHIPPKISKGPGTIRGTEGEEIAISCKANGLPDPKFEFLKDDGLTPLQSTSRLLVDADGGSISFRPLNKSDEGKYTCRVNNDVGSDSQEGHLRVLVKPLIYQFQSVSRTEGEKVVLECLSHGDPAPSMTFRKAGMQSDYAILDNQNDERIIVKSIPGKLQMTIFSLIPDDMSNYSCKSLNEIGLSEEMASVTVNFRPRFPSYHTKVVYIWAGKLRNITCQVQSEPAPSIDWLRLGRPLANNDTYRIFNLGRESSLQVRVREVDQGWIYGPYVCHAKNELGTSEHRIELRRATVPGEPSTIAVAERMPNSIIIDVNPPTEDGGEKVVGYNVEYEEIVQEFTTVNVSGSGFKPTYSSNLAIVDVRGTKITIENLKPSTTYRLKVRAKNDVGLGGQLEQTVITESIRKPYPIEIVSPMDAEPFDYLIEWKRPNTGGLPIKEYEFKVRRVRVDLVEQIQPWEIVTSSDNPEHPRLFHRLTQLTPNSTYQLTIRARNDIGWSNSSYQFTFVTREATEAEIESFKASASSGIVIGVVIAICLIILITIDLSCFYINGCGVTKTLCVHVCGKKYSKEKTLEEGESTKSLRSGEKMATKQNKDIKAEEKLKDSHPDGRNDTGNDTKEEITLEEKDKLMSDKQVRKEHNLH